MVPDDLKRGLLQGNVTDDAREALTPCNPKAPYVLAPSRGQAFAALLRPNNALRASSYRCSVNGNKLVHIRYGAFREVEKGSRPARQMGADPPRADT